MAGLIVTNYERPKPDMSIVFNVGVDYSSDLNKVEQVTVDVARYIQKNVEGGVRDFEPFIRYNNFGDSAISFSVILRGNTYVDKYLMTHEFIKRLKERYDKEGIVIPFPIRTVHLDSGSSGDHLEESDATMARSLGGSSSLREARKKRTK